MAVKKENVTAEEKFDGQTIIKSVKYKRYADILIHLLNDGELYTHSQVDEILKNTLKQPVKRDIN